jgi:hypothetical protein
MNTKKKNIIIEKYCIPFEGVRTDDLRSLHSFTCDFIGVKRLKITKAEWSLVA